MNNMIIKNLNTNYLPSNDLQVFLTGITRSLTKEKKMDSTIPVPVFKVFLLVLDVELSPIVIWPEGAELMASMPMCFQAKFGTKITTAIDCFELYYILKDEPV